MGTTYECGTFASMPLPTWYDKTTDQSFEIIRRMNFPVNGHQTARVKVTSKFGSINI